MSTVHKDRDFFQAGMVELEAYLLSDELFWPLSGSVDLPRLTLGGLLLAVKRLDGWNASLKDRSDLAKLEVRLDSLRSKWRSAWEKKVAREVHSCFDLWKNYLADYRKSSDGNAPDYPWRVRERVMLALLASKISASFVEFPALKDLDHFLRESLIPGPFGWEMELAPPFPANEFWYLYGKLKA